MQSRSAGAVPTELPVDAIAGQLANLARDWPRSRISPDDLMEELVRASPEMAVSAGRFARLKEAIDVLVADGIFEPSKALAPRQGIGLAKAYLIPQAERPPTPPPARSHPWMPLMAWCATWRWPNEETYGHVVAVNRWLASHSDGVAVVPVRERSLEITGHDKALGKLLDGPFKPRSDLLRALAVRDAPPPMAITEVHGATGRGILVVENGTTFHSVLEAASGHAERGRPVAWKWIGYGAGRQLGAILPSLVSMGPDPIAYFGDLDPEGLEIAAAGAVAARDGHLGRLLPHLDLYRALLKSGRPQHRESRKAWPAVGLAWLGAELADSVVGRLRTNSWLAQEWIGLTWLSRETDWLTEPSDVATV